MDKQERPNKSKIAEREDPSSTSGQGKSKISLREEEILKFWEENKIFDKSLAKQSSKGEFVFYEGPPTANGKPGIHHLEARAFKDIIPRYKTMRGYHVRRKGGWDTHGLPVELQVEKQLGLKSKKEIESYGIAEFNKKCKESVWEYKDIWEKFTERIGYWIDEKNPYITYENNYIESTWNILKEVNKKDLLYKDYKVVPWCPRCGTALSSHELAQGYETVKDLSVYVKFKVAENSSTGSKQEINTYLLAWTTTPWTLPGNVALAVGEKVEYVKIKVKSEKSESVEEYIMAKDRVVDVMDNVEYEVIEKVKGKDLIGLEYEPLYDFLKNEYGDKDKEAFKKAYKVYGADFVNTEDGTGIVHTAIMYGQDDFELATKIGLPKFHIVNEDGTFKNEAEFLSGKFVKDEETAVEIIKDLAHRDLLFKKEKYEHSYPHCWRCKTPLIYYARDSWYIKMSSLRGELVKENEGINWVPEHIKEGRFGEWLREVKDWAISRERYWGTPLPVWQNQSGKVEVIGSIEELKEKTVKSGNKYFVMRHGESEKNLTNTINSDPKNISRLTKKGKDQVKIVAGDLKSMDIDILVTSPFERCLETARIVSSALALQEESIIEDERISELKAGEQFEGKDWGEYIKYFTNPEERFSKAPEGGETLLELKKRVGNFIYDLENKYKNKKILIVSHEATINAMHSVAAGANREETIKIKNDPSYIFELSEFSELDFVPLPHNEDYELDLHKPYIDSVKLVNKDGEELTRVKEVMDVWFDSGGMPFAQDHYPFDFAQDKLQYPADYIAEAIDQTRGWFYTLHAIGVLLGFGKAYKNVICLGHILDAEGKKMSKSVGNIVDPWEMIEKYGADPLRLWMYSVNQPGDSKNFDEKTVDEIVKKVFNLTDNILSLYNIYKSDSTIELRDSKNVLDRWIISRLDELFIEGSKYLESYKVFEATRLIRVFVNDFSTWYIRRSRDRFKSSEFDDRNDSLGTTLFVLKNLSIYIAPFAPFFAEHLYSQLRSNTDPESVHLCAWPKAGEIDEEILTNMEEVRRVVSLALEKRNTVGIKVRQPLGKLKVKSLKLKGKEEYTQLIRDEVNIKEIIFDEKIEGDVELDTEITPELKREGDIRELTRYIQDLRKERGLSPQDKTVLQIETNPVGKDFVSSILEQIKKPTNLSEIVFDENDGEEVLIGDIKFKIKLR